MDTPSQGECRLFPDFMLTAQGKLDQTLISWYDLLSGWATDGSLATTAEHVLNLEGENAIEGADDLLQSYTSQWSLGEFESLPPIVLLSNEDISGAQGAYAASTDTIYLNENWLLTATEEDIIAVLTEELGAFLDDQLNTVDTQGDEGALFSAELLGVELTDAEVAEIQAEDDSVQISVGGDSITAEASAFTKTGKYLSLDASESDYIDTGGNYIPETGDFTISLWALATSAIGGQYREIISQGESAAFTSGSGFYIGFDPDGNIRIGDSWRFTGVPYPNDGQWHNIQVVKLGSEGSLYIDGILQATTTNLANPNQGSNLRIGNQFTTFNEYWDGGVDEIKIFNQALNNSDLDLIRQSLPIAIGAAFDADFENGFSGLEDESLNVNFSTFGSPEIASYPNTTPVIRGNSFYTIVNGPTWAESKEKSTLLGGSLVTINSENENLFLVRNFGNPDATNENQSEDIFFIGLELASGEWKWVSGEESTYRNWGEGQPASDGDKAEINLHADYFFETGWLREDGGWNDFDSSNSSGHDSRSGIAELILNSSVNFTSAIEGQALTTTFNLLAGTSNRTDLIEGANVYYKVTGIDSDDLDNTSPNGLTGSGTIQNGQLSLDFALKDDGIAENDTFSIAFYSDASLSAEYQIGSTASIDIVDSTPPSPIIRGNSLYISVKGFSWTDAETASQALGGYLATITSLSETAFVQSNYSYLVDQGVSALWIGLTDEELEGDFKWSDGTTFSDSQYAPWATGAPGTATSYPPSNDEDYVIHELTTGGLWNDIANEFWKLQDVYTGSSAGDAVGLAELTLKSSISLDSATEGSPLTTTFNLSAGTFNRTDLIEGANVYYKVTGIDSDDLDATTPNGLTGSGTIQNGQLSLDFALKDDGIAENDTFSIAFYSDDSLSAEYQIGSTASIDIVDSTPPAVIGTANGDAEKMVIFGDLVNDPNVQSYTVVEETKGKKSDRQSLTTFSPVSIDHQGPLDALVVNGDDQDNFITAQSFSYTDSNGITSSTGGFDARSGALVINGMGGSDTIFSATAGVTWMIGGGVSQSNGIDTLTGNSLTQEVYDLRKEDETNPGIWEDAYSMGHAVINGFDAADFVVLSGTNYDIINKTITAEVTKGNGKGGKTRTETTTHFEIYDTSGEPDLIAMVYGAGFNESSSIDQYIITGQTTDPFKVVLPGSEGGTIV